MILPFASSSTILSRERISRPVDSSTASTLPPHRRSRRVAGGQVLQIGLCPRRQSPSSMTPPTQGSMSR